MNKLKNRIDNMKKDNSSSLKYIKCFVNNDKVKELLNSNDSFVELKKFSIKKVSRWTSQVKVDSL